MAKLKIKGYNELVTVSDDEARRAKSLLSEVGVNMDQIINVGQYTGLLKNITAVFVGDKISSNDESSSQWKKYIADRRKTVSLSIEDKTEKQKSLFDLCVKLFKIENAEWNLGKQLSTEYLILHPYRIWVDIKIWTDQWSKSGQVNDYEKSVYGMLQRMMNCEEKEEEYMQGELQSAGAIPFE